MMPFLLIHLFNFTRLRGGHTCPSFPATASSSFLRSILFGLVVLRYNDVTIIIPELCNTFISDKSRRDQSSFVGNYSQNTAITGDAADSSSSNNSNTISNRHTRACIRFVTGAFSSITASFNLLAFPPPVSRIILTNTQHYTYTQLFNLHIRYFIVHRSLINVKR